MELESRNFTWKEPHAIVADPWFRSLLLAAFVLSNCITWTASRHHYTHNVNGHRSRHRRQGAGLFLSASYVLPGGEGTGAWGEWEITPCSRTCGGGVASQKRICLEVGPDGQPLCTGGDTKYFSCQTQDCPPESRDFRSEQCSEYNDISFKGIKYKWVPYLNGPNPCELNCMPRGERFYYRQKAKVTDGTLCNEETLDVCVNGTCQPVGCDRMLGSSAQEDKCLVCRGNGANCRTISGLLDSQDLRKGYNDMLLIPENATSILIEEVRDSTNYLAIRAKSGTYYLNGDYHIDFPRVMVIAGAHWHYERNQRGFAAPDRLRSLGPINEPLILSLLLQDENVGIKYEYSIAPELLPITDQQYHWVFDNFTPCSATCGGGFQTRNVTCRSREELVVVDDGLCEESIRPPVNQTCNTDACPAQWIEGPWSPCSKACGEGGIRSRQVQCQKIITNGVSFRFPSIVADKECFDLLGPKPELFQECNKNASCPKWFTGPWKPCDKLCGEGKQTRQVVCFQKSDNGRVEVMDDSKCEEKKPEVEQTCILHPCEGVDWVVSDWTGCDTCLSTVRTRAAECATKEREVVDPSLCAYHPTPQLQEPCDRTALPACEVQWYATQWSKCSADCGKGVQTRRIFCGLFDGSSVLKVDDSRCANQTKYNDTKDCEIPKEKCPAKWYAGPWSECTKLCGGGEQYRRVMCLRENKDVNECNMDLIIDATQSCNTGPCDKDETLPVNASAPPIVDVDYEYEDCIDEEEADKYEEVGAEEDNDTSSTFSMEDLMFSDSPSTMEGSGFTYISTETGSGDGSGVSWTDVFTTDTDEFTTSSDTSTVSSSDNTATESTESGATDETTESSSTDVTETADTSETESTKTSESGSSDTTESDVTATTESSSTDESTVSGLTDGSTESTDTDGTTESGDTGGTTESGSTGGITESGSTDITDSSSTDATSDFSSTEITTDSSSISGSTDSSPTESTDETTDTETTDLTSSSSTDDTTESGITEESTISGSTDIITTSESTDSDTGSTDGSTEGDFSSTGSDFTSTTSDVSSDGSTESGATDITTETGSTEELSTTEITGETTESGATTESSPTEETGSTESSTDVSSTDGTGTTEFVETESTETGSDVTEISTTEVTGGSTETDYSTTEMTGSSETEVTESTVEGSSTTEMSTDESTTESGGSTIWDYQTTLQGEKKRVCKPRKSKCKSSKFGCCPDMRTPAAGPFDEGCPNPKTCKESKFGCCPDGVSPAAGPKNSGCPIAACNETLYGCCLSDHITVAEGNDQEGCPPACKSSKYGCCEDGLTKATGPKKAGCPETEAKKKAEEAKKKAEEKKKQEAKKTAITEGAEIVETNCEKSKYGCCYDNSTAASRPDEAGCPCNTTEFGCCSDGVTAAVNEDMTNCANACNSSTFGCCPDGKTPAHGYDYEGCCLLYPHGCCPDNHMPAEGPHFEGCSCKESRYGCCPDNETVARGPENEGCGCQFSEFGCCPDRHTPAKGLEFEGCDCHTYQFGCCDDGVTTAKGPNRQGCHCRESKFGCCGDENTPAGGPNMEGCDCASSKYGCCPDGQTEAKGKRFLGCTDVPESKQAACSLTTDRGSCHNYTVYWYYDMEYGGCSRFWYGGCEGNGNRFATKEECEDVCVQPAPKDACKLPQVKGACTGYHLRWYYDSAREHCSQFIYGGCLGNANNYETEELCRKQCEPTRSVDQCSLPLDPGSCAGSYTRWGFNPDNGRCEQFTWGGCEGNTNRFGTEAACKHRCDTPGEAKSKCKLPQDAGNCTEVQAKWSFSVPENRCVPFYYTGCGGNDNRFDYENYCNEDCPAVHNKDICELPAELGECADYRQNWYYDTAHKRCLQFYYGGCGGNENNFHTLEQCESRCADQQPTTTTTLQPAQRAPDSNTEFCFMELDPGPCDDFSTRWGYDSARGICTTFEYGGCGGNRNNFPAENYCTYYCITTQDICQLPMMSGPCDASLMKWFYDPVSDSCSQFAYGGCEGNGNRFDTIEDCERRCRTGPTAPAPATTTTSTTTIIAPAVNLPPECHILPTAEECTRAGQVWYLDVSRRACVAYENEASGSGCRNTGVFSTEEACERSCGVFRDIDVCRYPKDPGPCREAIPKFYFDDEAGSCLEFMYGGCQGGPNRFSSIEECEQTCQPPETDPCSQPLEVGNCVNDYANWYYDSQRDECYKFSYSGCNGNDNRFETREDCEGRCRRRPAATTATPPVATPPQAIEQECRIPESLEPCGANITAFYYDPVRQECVAGVNGGCRYYSTYLTEEACERKCGAFRGLDASQLCRYPLDVGTCKASIPKYYWDIKAGRCEQYAYGGCGGGPNRFSTVEECEQFCGATGPDPACLEPVDTGSSCDEVPTRRHYYSPADGVCKTLVYKGCGGTNNNFLSYEHCAVHCERRQYIDTSDNEVFPAAECSRYEEECSQLRCAYSVQRTRLAGGCERCSCVPVEVDCEPLQLECRRLKCTYGLHRNVGDDGCERCRCIEHPCANKECPSNERCVVNTYKNPVSQEMQYSADCKIVNKTGACPREDFYTTEGGCRRECYDDADCRGVGKCCSRGCSWLCLEPSDSQGPRTTTYTPELPQAPQANTETEPEVAAQEGGKATLRCLFHGNPPPSITWRRGEITIDGSVGRYRVLSDGALEIVSLYRNDSGVYICIAENIHGVSRQEIRLQVNDPREEPAGISGEENSVVWGEIGRSLTIRCLAYGYPEPSVVWYRGTRATLVPFSSTLYEARGNVLLIRRLEEDLLDKYTCEAYNGVGRPASWSVVVQAQRATGWPRPLHTTYGRPTASTTELTTPPPEITVPVYTVPVKTRVTAESTTLAVGSELSLPCEVDGYPLPNVYWTKDGVPLSSDRRTQITEARLTITGLTPADSGVYGCHASNQYSTDHSTVEINVQGIFIPTHCTDNPFFANCHLIVRSKFCVHRYYSKFCCKSCMEAGQLTSRDFELQADEAWKK
ncbi:LOW QUALITY PROTEIN: proteoglycan-like sulfated glycoprotein papilin [Aphomia sociella]